MQNNSEYLEIEIAYARSNLYAEQEIMKLRIANSSNIQQAIELSGILHRFPEINLTTNKVGVFGKIMKLSDPINNGDRIEIYRDLTLNPNVARIIKRSGKI